MGLVSNMKARLAKQHNANARKANSTRKNRRNNVNKNMKNARNSGKFGSDLTNSRVSTRGLLPPRPKYPPPAPPSAHPKKMPRVCNSAYAKNLAARGTPLQECRLKGGKRRRRRKTKRRPTKKRRRTRRTRRTRRKRRR